MAGKKILVADDSLTIQKVIRLALSNEGYDIQAVSDGNDAFQQIAVFRPDVVVVDVALPGKNAFELKREVNSHSDMMAIKFILMSSAFEKMDEGQIEEVEFHGRLTKPFDPAHLRQVLVDALRSPTDSDGPTLMISQPIEFSAPPPLPGYPSDFGDLDSIPFADHGLPPDTALSSPPIPTPIQPSSLEQSHEQSNDESDIRNLTESTIKMSGLDDFEWSIKEPTLKPLPQMLDDGGASMQMEAPPSPPPATKIPGNPYGLPEFDSLHDEEDAREELLLREPLQPIHPGHPVHDQNQAPPPPSTDFGGIGIGVSNAEIESVIRKQVEETLEKIAMRILPEVAERVIKAEIHKLLNDQA